MKLAPDAQGRFIEFCKQTVDEWSDKLQTVDSVLQVEGGDEDMATPMAPVTPTLGNSCHGSYHHFSSTIHGTCINQLDV